MTGGCSTLRAQRIMRRPAPALISKSFTKSRAATRECGNGQRAVLVDEDDRTLE